MRDLASNIAAVASLAPAVQAATLKGAAVDLQGFNSAALIVNTGAIAGSGLFAMKMQESPTETDGDFTDVEEDDLDGDLPAALEADSTYVQGYKGTKQFIRAVITKTSGTSIAADAMIIVGHPNLAPVE